MSISVKTQKMLWGRAAGRCSYPDCRIELFEDETQTDDHALIGENCHIVAERDDGPRGDKTVSVDRRNSYNNLILLCCNHHKIVDSQCAEYTVDRLRGIKAEHENWVRDRLGFDGEKQIDDEFYADIVDKWEELVELGRWKSWTSWLLGAHPELEVELDENLRRVREYLLTRIWPERYYKLEVSFHNFRLILSDLQNQFHVHSKLAGDFYRTISYYKLDDYDASRYRYLLQDFNEHVDLIHDLTLELTRAANLICDEVRRYISPSYRREQGRIVAERGMDTNLQVITYVPQYSREEKISGSPYPGLKIFKQERHKRDICIGDPLPDASE